MFWHKHFRLIICSVLIVCVGLFFAINSCCLSAELDPEGVALAMDIASRAKIRDGLISIDLVNNNDDVVRCFNLIGADAMSEILTDTVDALYVEKVGREFLFTFDCMEYEVKEHLNGYLFMTSQGVSFPNALILGDIVYLRHKGWSLENINASILRSVSKIDMRERDLYNKHQSSYFNYWSSIREQYQDEYLKN